jgi:hypothetical protein
MWVTYPRSYSSGYHVDIQAKCYQKHSNLRCRWPVWNQATFVIDEEKLIVLVQWHECLYNLQHKSYDNNSVKDNWWIQCLRFFFRFSSSGKAHKQSVKEISGKEHCRTAQRGLSQAVSSVATERFTWMRIRFLPLSAAAATLLAGRTWYRAKLGVRNGWLIFCLGRELWIKMDLQEVGGGGGDWMELAQDRGRLRALVSTVKNLRVP